MTAKHAFQTRFAVPLTCDGCIEEVSSRLYALEGVTKVEANFEDQMVLVEGSAAPSGIVAAIQSTGRDAILRGSGASDSAAVCILESFAERMEEGPEEQGRRVKGLARLVQASPDRTLIDVTVQGLPPGRYQVSVREYGDVKEGAKSTGPVWSGVGREMGRPTRGRLGLVEVGESGQGAAFVEGDFRIWEVIGRGMAVTKQDPGEQGLLEEDEETLAGVVARSAGLWDNDKMVCSCTGRTLWEERREQIGKGML